MIEDIEDYIKNINNDSTKLKVLLDDFSYRTNIPIEQCEITGIKPLYMNILISDNNLIDKLNSQNNKYILKDIDGFNYSIECDSFSKKWFIKFKLCSVSLFNNSNIELKYYLNAVKLASMNLY